MRMFLSQRKVQHRWRWFFFFLFMFMTGSCDLSKRDNLQESTKINWDMVDWHTCQHDCDEPVQTATINTQTTR